MVIDSLLITAHIITQMTFDLESTLVLMDICQNGGQTSCIIFLTGQYLTSSLGNKKCRISSDFSTKYDSFGKPRSGSGNLAIFTTCIQWALTTSITVMNYFRSFAHDIDIMIDIEEEQ